MPGKVNPVIPEAVIQVAAQVMGNDTVIMMGGQAGNFELNVMLPVVAWNLLQSIGVNPRISTLTFFVPLVLAITKPRLSVPRAARHIYAGPCAAQEPPIRQHWEMECQTRGSNFQVCSQCWE